LRLLVVGAATAENTFLRRQREVENLEANLRSRLAGLTEPWARAQREQAALKADNVLMWNAIRSLTRHDQEERQRLLPLWDVG